MLKVENLTKMYNSNGKEIVGCKDISFEVNEGEVVSLLGLNGAGKSSILNMLSMYRTPTSGNAFINNFSIVDNQKEVKNLIGVLYEHNPLYENMQVKEFILFCAKMKNMTTDIANRVAEVLDFWDLNQVSNQLIKSLSKGFKQRVGLAASIVHKPKLLILDEPTGGLDAMQTKEFENRILELAHDTTILLSTHNLVQAEHICDKHILLNKGQIVAQGSMSELENRIEEQRVYENYGGEEHLKWTKTSGSILERAFSVFANVDSEDFKRKIYE